MNSRLGTFVPSVVKVVGDRAEAIWEQASNLCALQPNWDSDGASQVDPATAANAVILALKVTCPESLSPVLSPTRTGGVLVDWTWAAESVEIEVFSDGRIEVLVTLEDLVHEFETTLANDEHLMWIAHQVTGVGISRIALPLAS
jgi:hypothetical protein